MRIVHLTARPHPDNSSGRTLVVGGPDDAPLALRPARLTDRFLAALFGQSLDEQLATGRPPEETVRLAARAQRIVTFHRREALAQCWEEVVTLARRPALPPPRAVSLCRGRILAAETDIRELAARLRAPLPVGARGVAMARVLLTDGGGPLYRPAASAGSLVTRLRGATAWLDPSQPLLADALA